MKRVVLIIWCCILVTSIVRAQKIARIDSLILKGKEEMNEAVNSWNPEKMIQARAYFERLLSDTTYPWLVHYYIGFIDTRLFYLSLSEDNKEKAKQYVNDGIDHLESAIEIKNDFGEGYALLSSLLGNKIALNPLLGMTLGMKSGRMISQAFQLVPENPRVSLIAGQSHYYTPKMFGGGKEKSMEMLNKAIELFQCFTPESFLHPSWGYDEAYAYKGMIHTDWEQWEKAEKSFEKGLEVNPHNNWIRMSLLPAMERAMNNNE